MPKAKPKKKPAPRPKPARVRVTEPPPSEEPEFGLPVDERLTLKMSRFVDAYIANDGNGTRAADQAGYEGDENTLAVTAYRLLRKAKVRDAIAARLEGDPLVLNRVERLRLLTRIAKGDEKEVNLSLSGVGVESKPSLDTRMRAVKLLGDMAGENIKKVEHSGKVELGLEAKSTAELERELEEEDQDEDEGD